MKKLFTLLILLGIAGGAFAAYRSAIRPSQAIEFRTATVDRGDIVVAVSATGTLEPEDLVDIGTQVVGRVKELGIDARGETDSRFLNKAVDYGALVNEGQVLAKIDDSVYLAQRNEAKAALDLAQANVLQLDAKLMQASAEWDRAQKLRTLRLTSISPASMRARSAAEPVEIKGISDADFVLAQSNHDAANANVAVGKASVEQAAAALQLAETNLEYTVIRSPVTGTVIDRRVNIGQTVVSSLNAPSLFLIAKDLRRMQVWASVNEADIGLIKVDMPVKFTVDAFPDDVFDGQVVQIRLNATMTQNVVTYTVVVANDNADLKLLPYLTADVRFLAQQHRNVLRVPNAALRYQPRRELIAHATGEPVANSPSGEPTGTVWLPQGSLVMPVSVKVGATDGSLTEVESERLTEGATIVLGERQGVTATEDVVNPLGPPKIPKTSAPAKK